MQGKMVNRRRARVVLGGALILLVGCSQSRKTDEQLDQARTALAAARYDQCARLLEPAFREGIPRRDLAEALYMRAQCRVRSGSARSRPAGSSPGADRRPDRRAAGIDPGPIGQPAF
jgi:hypothetical protein